jgi:hypothetical protein
MDYPVATSAVQAWDVKGNSVEDSPPAPVWARLEEANKRMAILGEVIDKLMVRLGPVLGPELPRGGEQRSEPTAHESQLAGRLAELNVGLELQAERVEVLFRRLEV